MRVVIFGGTTESRTLLERGIPAICCVATDYGAKLLEGLPNTPGNSEEKNVTSDKKNAHTPENMVCSSDHDPMVFSLSIIIAYRKKITSRPYLY